MIFLINLPPPLHGMSFINAKLLKLANDKGLNVCVVNTTPSKEIKVNILRKFVKHSYIFISFVRTLIRVKEDKILYRPINGGKGQLIDVAYMLMANFFKYKIYIHHHSYNYLNKKSKIFTVLSILLRSNTTHIVLSVDMQKKLNEIYNIKENEIIVLSNIGFIEDGPSVNNKKNIEVERIVISYMANVTVEKGIDIFIKTCKLIDKHNPGEYEYRIAGPISDVNTQILVDEFISSCINAFYVGPVYGEEKEKFLSTSDIFYFPSKYKNEAEPLVLYEAASCGCLVIGSQVGSMRAAIAHICGESFPLTIDSDEVAINNFVLQVFYFITSMRRDDIYARKELSKQSFNQSRLLNLDRIDNLLDQLKQ
ncbi:glycosyltransferase family 4 protein [Klebsiella oxytoca]|uniref:Glycosyltransferase n=1 Tax=Klebsiella oxytoca TaxID=571 RepID=A0A6B8MWR0_KLEOX|nr:glycosyltransferase family 4 protein [Klebsiella oxytoca]QGN38813.1 glycosyltransferase [Klebsiella oxytoca]